MKHRSSGGQIATSPDMELSDEVGSPSERGHNRRKGGEKGHLLGVGGGGGSWCCVGLGGGGGGSRGGGGGGGGSGGSSSAHKVTIRHGRLQGRNLVTRKGGDSGNQKAIREGSTPERRGPRANDVERTSAHNTEEGGYGDVRGKAWKRGFLNI